MATFAYLARGQGGEEVNGYLQGGTVDEAIGQLHTQGLAVLHIVEDKGQERAGSWRAKLGAVPFGGVGNRDLALFSRQLSTVLEAGIPLIRGLRGLAADTSSRVLAGAISDISLRIERGETLSDAMTAHPRAFNGMYVSMVRAGERAGTLDQIVEQLAIYLEKVDEIETKVRSALSYPVFVLVFAILASLFLLLKIVPTFADIYADLGQDLPTVTRVVVDASNTIRGNALVSIAIGFAFFVAVVLVTRSRAGRYGLDVFKLNVPLFGPIVRKAVMSRFARTFGILLQSGLPVLQGLDLVRGATGNEVVSQAIDRAKKQIAAGRGITESFRSTGKFPEMTLQLMATGEEAGNLDTMLIKSSDFYDRQVEAAVHGISSLIEPMMIVLVGALIGVIVVAMFLPIFYLGDAIMQGGYNY